MQIVVRRAWRNQYSHATSGLLVRRKAQLEKFHAGSPGAIKPAFFTYRLDVKPSPRAGPGDRKYGERVPLPRADGRAIDLDIRADLELVAAAGTNGKIEQKKIE